jgi:stalled ribosome rescue protein Dom34
LLRIEPQLCTLLSHVVQEGLAHLCLVGSSTTLVRAKIEANLPRKRGPAIAGYDKAFDKFMDQVGQLLRGKGVVCLHVFLNCSALVLACGGWLRQGLRQVHGPGGTLL